MKNYSLFELNSDRSGSTKIKTERILNFLSVKSHEKSIIKFCIFGNDAENTSEKRLRTLELFQNNQKFVEQKYPSALDTNFRRT